MATAANPAYINDLEPEAVTEQILLAIEKSATAITLKEALVVHGKVLNPFQAPIIVKRLREALKQGGSHHHLTVAKKWKAATPKEAEAYGVEKGSVPKAIRDTKSKINEVEAVRSRLGKFDLPEQIKKTNDKALTIIVDRSGRKLDAASTESVVQTIETLNTALETARSDLKESKTRENRLMTMLENFSGGQALPQAAE